MKNPNYNERKSPNAPVYGKMPETLITPVYNIADGGGKEVLHFYCEACEEHHPASAFYPASKSRPTRTGVRKVCRKVWDVTNGCSALWEDKEYLKILLNETK